MLVLLYRRILLEDNCAVEILMHFTSASIDFKSDFFVSSQLVKMV